MHTKFGQKTEGKKLHAKTRMDGWEDNIKMYLKEIGW
jgi:hypothetical protein